MKLASFRAENLDRLGFEADGRLVDLNAAVTRLGGRPFGWMSDLIQRGAEGLALAREAKAAFLAQPEGVPSFAHDAVGWSPPILTPSKIVCLALNNSANSERVMKGPKHPATFVKPASALVGHGAAIECQPHYGRVHPEPELAVVIGKRAKNVSPADAYDHVFGYTIHNDITSPTMREEDTFHYRAIHPKAGDPTGIEYVDTWVSYPGRYKASDTFSPMGPWIVTRDEIADPHNLRIACLHAGKLVTEDNTRNLFFKTPEVIAFVSSYMTLLPGDIVSMGTALKASGAKAGGAVQNIDLNRLGGPVTVEIESIGELTSTVTRPPMGR